MRLMTDKGLLVRSERFRSHVYEPAAPKNQMQMRIAGDLLKRIFAGSPTRLSGDRRDMTASVWAWASASWRSVMGVRIQPGGPPYYPPP